MARGNWKPFRFHQILAHLFGHFGTRQRTRLYCRQKMLVHVKLQGPWSDKLKTGLHVRRHQQLTATKIRRLSCEAPSAIPLVSGARNLGILHGDSPLDCRADLEWHKSHLQLKCHILQLNPAVFTKVMSFTPPRLAQKPPSAGRLKVQGGQRGQTLCGARLG